MPVDKRLRAILVRGAAVGGFVMLAASAWILAIPTATLAEEPPPVAAEIEMELRDPRTEIHRGKRTEDGRCTYGLYKLELPQGDRAIGAILVFEDRLNCIQVIHVGVPANLDELLLDDRLGLQYEDEAPPAIDIAQGFAPASAAYVTSAPPAASVRLAPESGTTRDVEFRVWWEDLLGWDVTKTYSRLIYTNDGSCVTDSSGFYTHWSKGLTGWSEQSSNATLYNYSGSGCSVLASEVEANAHYQNSIFCAPGNVDNHNHGVSVYGTAYAVSGWVDTTYTTYPPLCPPLHWEALLVD